MQMDKHTPNRGLGRRNFFKIGAAASMAGTMGAQNAAGPSLAGEKSYAVSGTKKAWNVPQRKTAPISIDVHTHWAPAGYLKAKADLGRPDYANPINYDMSMRMRWMDANGVQMLVLTLGGFMPWQWVTAEQGAHIAQIVNDAAIEAHQANPDRFIAGIELPVGAPAESLKELNRVAGKPGLVCVHMPNSLASREYLFEPEFAPVLARINELGLPIFMHPLDGEPNWYAGHRLADEASGVTPGGRGAASLFPGLTNSIGETFEQATTAAKLISAGTLDKYPDLTVIFGHGAGAFPFVAGRMDWRSGGLKKPVQDYLRRYYYDSLVLYPLALRYLIDLVGSDRVVLGTDNLFNGENQAGNPHTIIDQLNLPEADRDLILRGNLKRLFRLT
jgi:aminocarboxymuconate-semialdehyde decarboxylase